VLVLAGVVQLVTAEASLEGRSGEVLAAEGQPRKAVMAQGTQHYYSPGFWSLRIPGVRKEIGLSDEQDKKIQAIAEKHTTEVRKLWADLKDLKPEERQEKYREIREKTQKLTEQARAKTEEILSAEQQDKLLLIQARRRGPWMLNSPAYQQKLGITDKQKASIQQKMDKMQEEMKQLQEKMQKLRNKTYDEVFELLTPEQVDKLKEMQTGGFYPYQGQIRAQPLKDAKANVRQLQVRPAPVRPKKEQ
jgi:hypothetical protein